MWAPQNGYADVIAPLNTRAIANLVLPLNLKPILVNYLIAINGSHVRLVSFYAKDMAGETSDDTSNQAVVLVKYWGLPPCVIAILYYIHIYKSIAIG